MYFSPHSVFVRSSLLIFHPLSTPTKLPPYTSRFSLCARDLVRLRSRTLVFLARLYSNGSSVISLVVPPKEQVSRISTMLTEEYSKASNIKSRVNRLSVLSAITSVQQRLKLFPRIPNNGLILYCGEVLNSDGK